MSVFQRRGPLVSEDLGALVPGNGVPLNRDSILRLILYLALALFILTMFLPDVFAPAHTSAPRMLQEDGSPGSEFVAPESAAPHTDAPESLPEERTDVLDADQI